MTPTPARRLLTTVFLATSLPFLMVELFPAQLHRAMDGGSYLVFHNVAEFFSIMVSLSVFGVGWFTYDQSKDRHALFLGTAFLATGLIDFMHAMSSAAMPAFITANSTNKSSQYWIAARLVDSSALLASAFIHSHRPLRWLTKYALLAAALAVSGVVFAGVTFFPARVPTTFVPGAGLTPFKVGAEYVVILLLLAALAAYWIRLRRTGDRLLVHYMAAFVLGISGEAAFASYQIDFDTHNVLGHVYKVAAFYLIYRAAFAASLRKPYLASDEARAQAAQLEAILNCVADGVIVYDEEGRTVRSTPAADGILGVPLEERRAPVRERAPSQYRIFTEDGRRLAADEMVAHRAAVHGETIRDAVQELHGGREEPRWLSLNAIPLVVDGRRKGAVLSMTDITHRKRAEQELEVADRALRAANAQLREADQRKDEFLGMLSHELRNPLAPIRNSAFILRHAAPDGDQARRAQAVIERQAEHLARLVDDLLDVTRIARGKIELRRSRLDLRDVVSRAAEDFRLTFEARGVAFRAEVPEAALWVEADAIRLAQVIGNLLHNAAKFTPGGGRVTLSLHDGEGAAELRVRDTGTGIDPALLPSVFDPFVQGERTLARTEGGLGLGLALVKGIAELHGGTVRAVSGGAEQGAEFVVRMPLASPGAEPVHRRATTPGVERRHHVLVVDDNADGANTLAEIVEMLGHAAEVAYDGPTAVAKARASRPDVVLCDIGLPGMDGYEVAQALREEHERGTRLFAMTGYARVDDVKRAAEAGFDGHLAKPCEVEQIERLLS